ncbi:MAG: sporulation integral membrane protein YtvI [Clostridiales bacterium]|nr:sporulation integral membrane protein YtvI [Clostridiales bacterium]
MNIFVSKALYAFSLLFLIIFGGIVFKKIFVFMIPFILAYYIAKGIHPGKNFLNKKLHIPIPLSTILTMVFVLSIFVVFFYAIISILIVQLGTLSEDLPIISEKLNSTVNSIINYIENFLKINPDIFNDMFTKIIDVTINALGDFTKNLAGKLLNFVTFLPSLLFYTIITVIATYYFSNDLDKIKLRIKNIIGKYTTLVKIRDTFKNDILFALVAYLKAQGILMIITFFIIIIGLALMGYKYAILIALGVSILDALPIFGTGTIFGPWIIIELLNTNYKTALVLGIIYIFATIVRQVMQPKILSTQIGINPLLTLLSIYAGIRLLGIFGIILGPMIMILIISIVKVIKTRTFLSNV